MMNKINVKLLKKSLTLAHYKQIMQALIIPVFNENKEQIVYFTGDKHKNALEGSPKLYFYKDTKIYFSYTSSRAYDIIALVQTRLNLLGQNCSFIDACNWILNVTGLDPTKLSKPMTSCHIYDWSELERFVRIRKYGNQLPEYDRNIIDSLPPLYPQSWVDEGISEETMAKYQIRYYERCQQTAIPCFDAEARLIGVRVRNWDEERVEQAKYMPLITLDGQCYKFNTNQVFYGINYNKPIIEQTGEVWLGESEKMVMKCDTFFGPKSCALAMFGHQLGLQRRNQLIKMGVKKVVFCPDHDFIGQDDVFFEDWCKSVRRLCDMFKGYCQVDIMWDDTGELLGPKENASDRDKETWDKLWNNREKYL